MHRWGLMMQSSEVRRSRKALAALVGFLARGPATSSLIATARQSSSPGSIDLMRGDDTHRKVDARLFKLALGQGLISVEKTQTSNGITSFYAVTPEGRLALKRWLGDPDSAFQTQHRTLVGQSDPDHGHLTVNQAESPLTALARIKGRGGGSFLEPSQLEAGERLRVDFTRGQLQPSLGQSWEPVRMGRQSGRTGGAADLGDAALAARMRVEAALTEVGPELSGVLLDVCCFLKGLAEVERERQWPARSAKLMLRTALAALTRHYSMPRRKLSRPPAQPPHAP